MKYQNIELQIKVLLIFTKEIVILFKKAYLITIKIKCI